MAKVVIENLLKIFPEKNGPGVRAVNDISLVIEDREFMVFVGPSGCGKSTTLRMIAGLEEISGGTIAIDGKIVNDVLPKDRDIAMVFQNYALYPHMSVYDNMAFGLKMRKFQKPEIDQRVRDAADILGIGELLKRKPRQLSGGQRQRVAIARATIMQPAMILADEPTGNLDRATGEEVMRLLEELNGRGVTLIVVTHDTTLGARAGRQLLMEDGELRHDSK
jgi:multiple sugar transport system ATP-binding protein